MNPTSKEDLHNFLREKCENIQSPLNIKQTAIEYIEKSGSTTLEATMVSRITRYGQKILRAAEIDENEKIKILFGLGIPVTGILEKLRESADVSVDKKGRITRYVAIDGSLRLEGTHSAAAKQKETIQLRKSMGISERMGEEEEEDDSQPSTSTPVTGSTKRKNVSMEEIQPKRMKSEIEEENDDYFMLQVPEIKLEPFEGKLIDNGDDFVEEVVPKKSDPNPKRRKVLKNLNFVVISLNLKALQTRIEMFLNGNSQETVHLEAIQLAIDTCLFFIKGSPSVPPIGNSISLIGLLYSLRQFVVSLRLPELEDVLAKIQKNIDETVGREKNIPIEEVESALTSALNIFMR